MPLIRALLFLFLAGAIAGAAPSTQPADRKLGLAYMGLSDVDAAVRARSRQELMDLKRSDLPALKRALEPIAPLNESSAAMLREIVMHVWLREEPYQQDPMGFLGITMNTALEVEADAPQVVVSSRMIGFCGFQALQDGDAIVGIAEHPTPRAIPREEFIDAVKAFDPGQQIHLKLLRRGKEIQVEVKLNGRPRDPTNGQNEIAFQNHIYELLHARSEAAEGFWDKEFGAMVPAAPADR